MATIKTIKFQECKDDVLLELYGQAYGTIFGYYSPEMSKDSRTIAIILKRGGEEEAQTHADRILESWNNYDQLKADNEALKVALAPFVLFAREVTRINKGDKNEILYESGESSLVLYEFQKAIDTWNNILKNK